MSAPQSTSTGTSTNKPSTSHQSSNHQSSSSSSNNQPNNSSKLPIPPRPSSLTDIDHRLFHLETFQKLKHYLPTKVVTFGDDLIIKSQQFLNKTGFFGTAVNQSRLIMLTLMATVVKFIPEAPVKWADDLVAGFMVSIHDQYSNHSTFINMIIDSASNAFQLSKEQIDRFAPILIDYGKEVITPENWYKVIDQALSFMERFLDKWMPLPSGQAPNMDPLSGPNSDNIFLRIYSRSKQFIEKVRMHFVNYFHERQHWIMGIIDSFAQMARPMITNIKNGATPTTTPTKPSETEPKVNGEPAGSPSTAKTNGSSPQTSSPATAAVPQSASNSAKIEKVLGVTPPTTTTTPKQPEIDLSYQQQVFAAVDQIVSNGNSNNNEQSSKPEQHQNNNAKATVPNNSSKQQSPQAIKPQQQQEESSKKSPEVASKTGMDQANGF